MLGLSGPPPPPAVNTDLHQKVVYGEKSMAELLHLIYSVLAISRRIRNQVSADGAQFNLSCRQQLSKKAAK